MMRQKISNAIVFPMHKPTIMLLFHLQLIHTPKNRHRTKGFIAEAVVGKSTLIGVAT
jgi:hypothetical protein